MSIIVRRVLALVASVLLVGGAATTRAHHHPAPTRAHEEQAQSARPGVHRPAGPRCVVVAADADGNPSYATSIDWYAEDGRLDYSHHRWTAGGHLIGWAAEEDSTVWNLKRCTVAVELYESAALTGASYSEPAGLLTIGHRGTSCTATDRTHQDRRTFYVRCSR